jgi:hypothetical protein
MRPPFLYKPQYVSQKEQVMPKSFAPLAASCVAFAALALSTAVPAGAADLVNAKLAACSKVGTSIGGVDSCGKMWKLKSGNAQLSTDGKLTANVTGLVLNDTTVPPDVNGTADGVTEVVASLVCSGGGGPKVVAETTRAPLSKSGEAKISAKVMVPKDCAAPVLLIREIWEGKVKGWLAATAF